VSWVVARIAQFCRESFLLICVCFALASTGCAIVRRVSSATEEKLWLQSPHPVSYAVQVAAQTSTNLFAVPPDGHVTIAVPGMGPGCTSYLFGLRGLPVNDQSPYNWRIIHVVREAEIVRSLSLKQVGRLPKDQDGYRLLRVD
jgi:hypothetical protein